MPRDITNLIGRDLDIKDAKEILSEMEDGLVADYWSDRQLWWKSKVEDILEIKFLNGGWVDKAELFQDMAKFGVTHGWPNLEVDRDAGLVKIGVDGTPYGECWVTVKKFQLDDCNLLPADFHKGRKHNRFDGIVLEAW